tara:strand:+ start:1142 stop:1663 length:522 start_codon:yes stop_codon:yes gene_type:complete
MKRKTPPSTRVYHYEINEEGELLFEGKPLLDEKTIGFFLRHLKPIDENDPDASPLIKGQTPPHYVVYCQGEKNFVTCLDAPLVTTSLDITKSKEGNPLSVILNFRGGIKEALDPKTLCVGKNNILYFMALKGKVKGRFSRKCYIEITNFISEKGGAYTLEINDESYPIKPDVL